MSKSQIEIIKKGVKELVKTDLKTKVQSQIPLANQILKQTYIDLGVYKTGRSYRNSEIILTPDDNFIGLTFSTGSLGNVPYIPYWFYGLGSNRSKGARQTISVAVKIFIQQLKLF